MAIFTFTTIEIVLLSVLGLFFIIQLFYVFGIYNRIFAHQTAVEDNEIEFSDELPPISVIIRACNESSNLRDNLEFVLQQDYPQFEVIVINDGSTDESEELLSTLEQKYTNLYHSFTPEQVRNLSSKKLALTLGIKASKYDWLLFTEANCHPDSNQWLRMMARNFTPTTDIVLGYSSYFYKKGWNNKFVCFDNLFYSMRYLGLALNSKPFMGIGRNLAYRKHLFYDNKGYSHYLELFRGEDDLFINEVSNDTNTRVETSPESITRIATADDYYTPINWRSEKISYMFTSQFYAGSQRFILGFDTFSRFLFIALFLGSLILGILCQQWLVVGISALLWLAHFIIRIIIFNRTSKKLGEKRTYYVSLLLFDFILPWQSLSFRFSPLARKENNCVNINNPTHNAWS